MSNWVVTAMLLNAALVAATIVFALRIAGRSALQPFDLRRAELHGERSPLPESAPDADAARLPPFSSGQMKRTEWHALLDAFGAARRVYLRELRAWHAERPRAYAGLTRAKHELEVAKCRLLRFELEMTRWERSR